MADFGLVRIRVDILDLQSQELDLKYLAQLLERATRDSKDLHAHLILHPLPELVATHSARSEASLGDPTRWEDARAVLNKAFQKQVAHFEELQVAVDEQLERLQSQLAACVPGAAPLGDAEIQALRKKTDAVVKRCAKDLGGFGAWDADVFTQNVLCLPSPQRVHHFLLLNDRSADIHDALAAGPAGEAKARLMRNVPELSLLAHVGLQLVQYPPQALSPSVEALFEYSRAQYFAPLRGSSDAEAAAANDAEIVRQRERHAHAVLSGLSDAEITFLRAEIETMARAHVERRRAAGGVGVGAAGGVAATDADFPDVPLVLLGCFAAFIVQCTFAAQIEARRREKSVKRVDLLKFIGAKLRALSSETHAHVNALLHPHHATARWDDADADASAAGDRISGGEYVDATAQRPRSSRSRPRSWSQSNSKSELTSKRPHSKSKRR